MTGDSQTWSEKHRPEATNNGNKSSRGCARVRLHAAPGHEISQPIGRPSPSRMDEAAPPDAATSVCDTLPLGSGLAHGACGAIPLYSTHKFFATNEQCGA